ncbi:hypothetical protein [Legionella micdadei]|uniref:Flagellar FliJ protein n=1 Tax=Legionella micdadei TaxID=451 RepID=A0A098GGL9_LEGMI|nr:hypothetical protein [Legionella micdadei]ARG96959.1 hypothetical protein B6N58_04330 [Legionella micdadei]ARH00786.1 hypothetical protein B6V88_10370 [Legionella micdadei]KTD26669.1 hypothetical protein Lmic_2763 [Legionella micdadei]NSL19474.1 hypothetical protein [Legionella micdadei]CEG61634.1 conserved protein of unknown function [coiled-coil domains] [Legionella micdadei]
MNKTLLALMNKLSWQLNEVKQLSQAVDEEQRTIEKTLDDLHQQIHKAYATPAIINPEQEIARLNFIIQQQQKYDNLSIKNKELNTKLSQLYDRKVRLQIELKMLEKYQEKQRVISIKNDISLQQNANDEWILQRKETS